jgi:hypothetical protein
MSGDAPFNGRTALVLRLASVLVPLSLVMSAVAAVGGYVTSRDVADQNDRLEQVVADLKAENLARRESSCEAADETRQILRQLTRDGDLEVGESIIEVADADAGIVAQFREILGRRLTANVNQLPGRRWDPEAGECVDVELGE